MTNAAQYFRPIGSTIVFRVVEFYDAAGFIPAVYGATLDGRRCIHARVKDVIAVSPSAVREGR